MSKETDGNGSLMASSVTELYEDIISASKEKCLKVEEGNLFQAPFLAFLNWGAE